MHKHMTHFPIEKFRQLDTPFYYYDTELLDATLDTVRAASEGLARVHYAVKACANPKVLRRIARAGLGADCVSGGEITVALEAGFSPGDIVFAGVGKSDREIRTALEAGIGCFNVESRPELENISALALAAGRTARVAFRINPDVDAHTHEKITTGKAENKFGIAMEDMTEAIRTAQALDGVEYTGLHFHIGSQILEQAPFERLALRINELQDRLEAEGIRTESINVGGGLGIDYEAPDRNPIPDFQAYFDTFRHTLRLRPHQELHCELGRSITGQCGTLVARTLYVKQTTTRQFVILDAGMTELVRPAMYGSLHAMQNLTSSCPEETYDIVGPVCESSDVFGKDYRLAGAVRGDLIALRSAGAYGESMASCYNCRPLPAAYVSDEM